jgi:hypothetical protein
LEESKNCWEFKNFNKDTCIPEIKIIFPYPMIIRAYEIIVPQE